MEDKAFLLQQIEFLEFQLEDAKLRETQQKSMYESMLKSFAADTQPTKVQESPEKLKQEHLNELHSLETLYKSKISALESASISCEMQIQDLKNENFNVRNSLEGQISLLNLELSSKVNLIAQYLNSIKQFEECVNLKDMQILMLKKEIDEIHERGREDRFNSQREESSRLEELRSIYEKEKKSLENTIKRFESDEKIKTSAYYLTILLSDLDRNNEKMQNLRKVFEKILKESRECMENIIKAAENQVPLINELPIKQKLDLTEKMLKFSISTQENFSTIKLGLNSLKKLIINKEEKEKAFKETMKKKNQEIEILQRAISIKASDGDKTQNCKLIEEIIRKDTEISSLKRIIGELREADYGGRPPICTPQHKRSKTMGFLGTSPFKMQIRPLISNLELTVLGTSDILDQSNEGNLFTTASTDRIPEEKTEIYEKKINSLKSALVKLKNQRDRAKNLSEKLLVELKQRKLDLAVAQENFAEQKFSLFNQIKTLACYLTNVANSSLLPKMLKQDFAKVLGHYSQYV